MRSGAPKLCVVVDVRGLKGDWDLNWLVTDIFTKFSFLRGMTAVAVGSLLRRSDGVGVDVAREFGSLEVMLVGISIA